MRTTTSGRTSLNDDEKKIIFEEMIKQNEYSAGKKITPASVIYWTIFAMELKENGLNSDDFFDYFGKLGI